MGDKRNPALILDSTYMQNMLNDNYTCTTEWSAQCEHANASAAEFVSLFYNYGRRVTRPSAVLVSL